MNANLAKPHGKATPRPRLRGFTLVEMMVVIVIAAIVMAIAIPSFVKMTSGSAVRSGTRLVAAQIRLTRQHAISQRRTIALLMPTSLTDLPDELCYVAMKPAYVKATGDSKKFDFDGWVEGAKWLHIPRGAVIAEADSYIGIGTPSGSPTPQTTYTATPQINNPSVVKEIKPANTMKDLHESLTISTSDEIRAIVFSPTGRVVGTDVRSAHITIAQMTYVGGSTPTWINRAPGGTGSAMASANQFNIEINPFTGRIRIDSPGGRPAESY